MDQAIDLPREVFPHREVHKAKNRSLHILGLDLANGQEFQDAIFDLFEIVVIFVQDLLSHFEVEMIHCGLVGDLSSNPNKCES